MAKIGSWWTKSIDSDDGEQVLWTRTGNHRQSAQRAAGGKLVLTDRRLVFTPHLFDGATGGHTWEIALTDVAAVGVEPKGGDRKAGGLRDRLRIEATDGSKHLFVVNGLPTAIEHIEAAVQHARPAHSGDQTPKAAT